MGNKVRENNLFATEFTSLMESDLDSIEIGKVDAASKWNEFVTSFDKIQEIMAKEKDFTSSDSKWIVYVPEIKVLE